MFFCLFVCFLFVFDFFFLKKEREKEIFYIFKNNFSDQVKLLPLQVINKRQLKYLHQIHSIVWLSAFKDKRSKRNSV